MPAKRTIKPVTPATPAATSAKPVKPARKIAVAAKPKPADKPAVITVAKPSGPLAPVKPSPATALVTSPDTNAFANMPRGLARDAAGIVRAATNFAQYSDRDSAYLAFFGSVLRANKHSATLRQIHDAGITRSGMPDRKRFNPNYTGSGKATDVGAINRLIADGYFTRSADGNTISATPKATANAIYCGTKA